MLVAAYHLISMCEAQRLEPVRDTLTHCVSAPHSWRNCKCIGLLQLSEKGAIRLTGQLASCFFTWQQGVPSALRLPDGSAGHCRAALHPGHSEGGGRAHQGAARVRREGGRSSWAARTFARVWRLGQDCWRQRQCWRQRYVFPSHLPFSHLSNVHNSSCWALPASLLKQDLACT